MKRAAGEQSTPVLRQVPSRVRTNLSLLFVVASAAIVTGTVVTATGPHAGDEDAVRFGFELTSVARVHSGTVIITVALIVYLAWKTVKDSSFLTIREPIQTLLFAAVAQAAVGYTQYFTGVPAALVAAHIVGSLFFFVAVLNILLSPQT